MPRQEFDAKIGYTSAFNPVAGASVAPPLSGMGAGGADVPWYAQPDTPSVQVPPSPIDPGLRPLAVGAQGVARNVAAVFGMPVDIATGAAHAGLGAATLLTGSDFQHVPNPIGGHHQQSGKTWRRDTGYQFVKLAA